MPKEIIKILAFLFVFASFLIISLFISMLLVTSFGAVFVLQKHLEREKKKFFKEIGKETINFYVVYLRTFLFVNIIIWLNVAFIETSDEKTLQVLGFFLITFFGIIHLLKKENNSYDFYTKITVRGQTKFLFDLHVLILFFLGVGTYHSTIFILIETLKTVLQNV